MCILNSCEVWTIIFVICTNGRTSVGAIEEGADSFTSPKLLYYALPNSLGTSSHGVNVFLIEKVSWTLHSKDMSSTHGR